ncbi:MAG TPA: diguanylate cyclase [Eoetvoesiella sp.]|uniref:diguanylate cyclase domain-containing protein n=1 Tax=Eoetvoesiella sp. TaxID=1966355 RepID=UPI002C6E0DA2|nr:diguanylate cyclase [Eoetvoesiella sp.]HWK62328.1 diguanylate cyclase [Eoetvoesiella sp.]
MIFQSLKFRMVALCLVVLAVGVALRFGIALPLTKENLRQQAAAQQFTLATYMARDIGQHVQARRQLIAHLAKALPPSLLLKPREFTQWAKERRSISPLLADELLLLDADGEFLEKSLPGPGGTRAEVLPDPQWFRAALAANEPAISKVIRNSAQGAPFIVIAAPVNNSGNRSAAVLAGVFKLDAPGLLQALRDDTGINTGGLVLVSPKERTIIGTSNTARPTPPSDKNMNRLLDQAWAGYHATGISIDVNGEEELAAAAGVPGTDWFVVAHLPTAQAFLPLQLLERLAIQGSLVGLAGILLIMLLILPRMLRPLTGTARAMREIADGKRELKPLPVQRNDEIGSMVLGFNYLVTRLAEKEAALRESEIRLSFLAHHDSLTGLYNRAMLEDRLQHALDRAAHNGARFALLFCDLDGFKEINDRHGHKTGDVVLTQVASRLQKGRKNTDTIARLGGDEFIVLLSELDDARGEAAATAVHYLEQIGKPYRVGGKTFTLSVSIGIALFHQSVTSGSQLLSQADIAMYRAKHTGKDGYCFFEESMAESLGAAPTAQWITASRLPRQETD